MRSPIVRDVHALGLSFGPQTEDLHACGHPWGDHVLHVDFETPFDGGTISCPGDGETPCPCFELWSVKNGQELKRKFKVVP